MKIESINVQYSQTQSLSGYCNVRPGLGLTVTLEEGDNPDDVRDQVLRDLKARVRAEVDEALEQDGQPPRYFDGTRYKIVMTPVAYLIWPNDQRRPENYPDNLWWRESWVVERRLEVCRELAKDIVPEDRPIFECLDGELPAVFLALILIEEEEKARQEQEKEGAAPDYPDPYYGEDMYGEDDDEDDEDDEEF